MIWKLVQVGWNWMLSKQQIWGSRPKVNNGAKNWETLRNVTLTILARNKTQIKKKMEVNKKKTKELGCFLLCVISSFSERPVLLMRPPQTLAHTQAQAFYYFVVRAPVMSLEFSFLPQNLHEAKHQTEWRNDVNLSSAHVSENSCQRAWLMLWLTCSCLLLQAKPRKGRVGSSGICSWIIYT